MEVKYLVDSVVCSLLAVGGVIGCIRILKEIKRIKPDSGDGNVKAVVVNIDPFLTGDVAPIVSYTSGSREEKKYKYYYWYNRKKYPIGKEVSLKLSSASGLAYDRKDLIKGFLFALFSTLMMMMAALVFAYAGIFMN